MKVKLQNFERSFLNDLKFKADKNFVGLEVENTKDGIGLKKG